MVGSRGSRPVPVRRSAPSDRPSDVLRVVAAFDLFPEPEPVPTLDLVALERADSRPQHLRVLTVCTGNLCRSPLAEALLQRELTNLGVPAFVTSAGTDAIPGLPVPPPMLKATGSMLVNLRRHRAVRLTPDLVDETDLIITMTRDHLRTVVGMVRNAFGRTFTLKELARRAAALNGSRPITFQLWLAALNDGRDSAGLLGADDFDDIEDPHGRSPKTHRRVALEIESLIWQVADNWPVGGLSTSTAGGTPSASSAG